MATKVNGASKSGEFLGKNLDFFTVQTTLDIRPTSVTRPFTGKDEGGLAVVFPLVVNGVSYANATEYNAAFDSQKRFDKLVEIVGTRAQPIILGGVTVEEGAVSGLPTSGADVEVYTVKFAIEHTEAWDNTELSLADSLDGVAGFVHTVPTTNNNVMVTKATVL